MARSKYERLQLHAADYDRFRELAKELGIRGHTNGQYMDALKWMMDLADERLRGAPSDTQQSLILDVPAAEPKITQSMPTPVVEDEDCPI